MYSKYFKFTHSPFNDNPDPDFFFMSNALQKALLMLMEGLRKKKDLLTVVGEAGTGKTALFHFLQTIKNQVDDHIKFAFINHPEEGLEGAITQMHEQLGIRNSNNSFNNLESLEESLFHLYQVHLEISMVLVIDNAHNLQGAQWEQIKLLLNSASEDQKLWHFILLGRPELPSSLTKAIPFSGDISHTTSYLDPFNEKESFQYISHQLKNAGQSWENIFSIEALLEIYHLSKGVPRDINTICDRTLLLGFSQQQQFIDQSVIRCLPAVYEDMRYQFIDLPCLTKGPSTTMGRPFTSESQSRHSAHHQPQMGPLSPIKEYPNHQDNEIKTQDSRAPFSPISPLSPPMEKLKKDQEKIQTKERVKEQPKKQVIEQAEEQIKEPAKERLKAQNQQTALLEESKEKSNQEKKERPEMKPPFPREKKMSSYYQTKEKNHFNHYEILGPSSEEKPRIKKYFDPFLPKSRKKTIAPSTMIEEYQKIKNNLFLANTSINIQSIMFASSNRREGASTVAINFAITLAATENAKVLLVDANLRFPHLHSFFSLPKNGGLAEVLSGMKAWENVIHSCKIPNLSIITSGRVSGNHISLFESSLLKDTVQELREKFDYILFDTCAINAYPDPVLLGSKMDGLILVVQADRTRKEIIQRATEVLYGSVRILGVVLNRRHYHIPDIIYKKL